MNYVEKYKKEYINKMLKLKKVPNIKVGDTVKIHNSIIEGTARRKQIFEGDCLAVYNRGIASSIKLKKITKHSVLEKSFPIYSPIIEKIEITKKGNVKRAKLYYMRYFVGKAARIKKNKLY